MDGGPMRQQAMSNDRPIDSTGSRRWWRASSRWNSSRRARPSANASLPRGSRSLRSSVRCSAEAVPVAKPCDGCRPGASPANAPRRMKAPARIARRAPGCRLPFCWPAERAAHDQLGGWIERHAKDAWQWCGRSVKVLDGCGLSMPDTDENRARWPYAGGQKPGCGFPTAQMVGLFCLATGQLVRFALDAWKAHEIPLARQLIGWMETGEIVLTDRGFCGWGFIALLQRKGVDVVMRAHQARKLKGRRMSWAKPQRPETWTKSLWHELPAELAVRSAGQQNALPCSGARLPDQRRRACHDLARRKSVS